MRLVKNMKRGPARVLADNGGFSATFEPDRLCKVRVHFEGDGRYFRFVAELDVTEAANLRDNLNRWLNEHELRQQRKESSHGNG